MKIKAYFLSLLLLTCSLAGAQTFTVNNLVVNGLISGAGTPKPVDVRAFGAKCDSSTDDTIAINNALLSAKSVYLPPGGCKVTATVNIPAGGNITGNSSSSSLLVYGSHGITVGGDFVTISNIGIFSFTSGGSPDPRTFRGINSPGTSGTHINSLFVQNVYAQGWSDAAYLSYTWTSKLIGFNTVNTNNGVTLFGQSVNDAISDSTLTVNGGNASILLTPDVSTLGEGLTVTNSLLSSGTYGISMGTGFLALNVSNCIVDLVSNTAFNLTDARSTRISNNWIYATNFGVKFNDLGSAGPENSSIVGNTIQVTASSGSQGIYLGSLNSNFSITGNSIQYTGTSVGIFSNGGSVSITGNNFINGGSGSDITVNTNPSTHWLSGNTGVSSISGGAQAFYSYANWTPADASGAGLTFTQNAQANYVKNGRMVTATADITWPSTANGSNASVTLPFAPLTGAAVACSIGFQTFAATFTAATSSAGVAQIFMFSTAGAAITNANLSTKRVNLTCNYISAS